MAKLQMSIAVETPKVPNFVQLEDGRWIPLCDLTNDCIDELVEDWKEAFNKRAGEQYKDRNNLLKAASSPDPKEFTQKQIATFISGVIEGTAGLAERSSFKGHIKEKIEELTGKKGKEASIAIEEYIMSWL